MYNPFGTSRPCGIVLSLGTVCSAPIHQSFGSGIASRRVEQDQELDVGPRWSVLSKCQGASDTTRPPLASTDPLQSAGAVSAAPSRSRNVDWFGRTPDEFWRPPQPDIITTASRAPAARDLMMSPSLTRL